MCTAVAGGLILLEAGAVLVLGSEIATRTTPLSLIFSGVNIGWLVLASSYLAARKWDEDN